MKWADTMDTHDHRFMKISWYLTPDENENCLSKLKVC